MKVWVEDIWIKHIRAECQKLGFENALLTFDAFAAHLTDDVESQLLEANTDTLAIPAGCTSKCQPHGCLPKRTIQSHLTKILGELHFKCCRNFP